jgi:molybdenum cofactor synthesis domain-containing protein
MDGYAGLAEDSSPWREIIGEQTAGFVAPLEVTPGVAVRITTGAPIPPGADAVIQIEHTELADDHVVIHQEVVRPGENIRPIGADLKQGETVLPAGTVLGPAEIGLLAGLGVTPVPVRRRPRVSIISTGDELVEPDSPVGPGQIRDSNRFSLIAAVSELGDVIAAEKAPDQQDQLETLLRDRIAASDIVITSGGVSMGQLDLVKVILGQLATVHFRRIFMKPGKPLNFATAGDTLIFGLPGNPVSALVNFEVFIRPAMATMMGQVNPDRPRVRVALAHDVTPTDRIELQRATVRVSSEATLVATTTGVQASSRLASFVGANALLVIPPRETPYKAGETVDALLLSPPENE